MLEAFEFDAARRSMLKVSSKREFTMTTWMATLNTFRRYVFVAMVRWPHFLFFRVLPFLTSVWSWYFLSQTPFKYNIMKHYSRRLDSTLSKRLYEPRWKYTSSLWKFRFRYMVKLIGFWLSLNMWSRKKKLYFMIIVHEPKHDDILHQISCQR